MSLISWKKIKVSIVALEMLFVSGCGSEEDKSNECSDAECYSVCYANSWAGMDQSYWKFEAYCINGDTCNCSSSCDEARCNKYCIEEKKTTGGSCDILDCVCGDSISDAGPDASE